MITITKSREVPSPANRVWDVVSNTENEQKYWPTLKNIRILSREGNKIEREATITRGPMGDAKSRQTLILNPEERSIKLNLTKGPMLGTRNMTLTTVDGNKTKIDVAWEFELKGVPGFAQGFVKDNISGVTEKALDQIVEEAQRTSLSSATER